MSKMTVFSYGQGTGNWGIPSYLTRRKFGEFDHQSIPAPTLASGTGVTGKDGGTWGAQSV